MTDASAPQAYHPAEYELADVQAIKAVQRGEATPEQQKRALAWIIEAAALTYDQHYRPHSDRDTSFGLGRQFVGQQVVKLIKIDATALYRAEKAKAEKPIRKSILRSPRVV